MSFKKVAQIIEENQKKKVESVEQHIMMNINKINALQETLYLLKQRLFNKQINQLVIQKNGSNVYKKLDKKMPITVLSNNWLENLIAHHQIPKLTQLITLGIKKTHKKLTDLN
ncbi:unnamed protein product [Paramecium octaurelia]|uniref:Uncharacterized protein n=1 Tax=Paramecium octaurelia TaxID=43137 RepID=A0A8S1YKN6_PAROT|nr:unnamed protein product [Paramecium octaurelia]CAD8214400.1 unnamed protein product [Paramecium octaurelia]